MLTITLLCGWASRLTSSSPFEAVYNFAAEFMRDREVSNSTLQAAKNVLGGDRGVVDLVGTMALYQLSSMMVSLDQTPLAAEPNPTSTDVARCSTLPVRKSWAASAIRDT